MKRTLAFVMFAACCLHAGESTPALPPAELTGTMPDVINESSGVIRSRRFPDKDVFWTHNDSGDSARIFAISSAGKVLREVAIPHAANRDWEEISMDDRGRIVICDIGDNDRKHPSFTLYRIAEPDAFNAAEPPPEPQAFQYRYLNGEGPFDAEGLLVCGEFAYLFTKDVSGTRCYQLPLPEKPPENPDPLEVHCVADTTKTALVTGAALSADGRHVALCTYLSVSVLDLPEPFAEFAKSPEKLKTFFTLPKRTGLGVLGQTEGVCFDGNDLVLTTESGVDLQIKGVGKVYRIKNAIGAVAASSAPAADTANLLGEWSGKWVDTWQYNGQGGDLSCTLTAGEGSALHAVFKAPGFMKEPTTVELKVRAEAGGVSTSGAVDMGKPAGTLTFTAKLNGDSFTGQYDSPEERGKFEMKKK